MKTVLITGGTGLLGKRLSELLIERNYKVIIVSRQKKESKEENVQFAQWDIEKQTIDDWAIEQANYIIHLAGASVSEKRWTKKRKQEIIESRTKSSELIIESLKRIKNNVEAVVSASAIGWYGADTNDSINNGFSESNRVANNFLGLTCKQWEESIQPVENLNKRLAILRIGIVLSNRGGAFVEFIKSLKFRVASIIGNGNQIISWIHIDDVCNIFINSIENKSIKGAFNCVAPNPVSNKILMKTIGNIYCNNKFISIFIPTFLIKIFLGEFSIEVLKSTNVSSKKVEETGFEFQYPNIEKAIEQLKNN